MATEKVYPGLRISFVNSSASNAVGYTACCIAVVQRASRDSRDASRQESMHVIAQPHDNAWRFFVVGLEQLAMSQHDSGIHDTRRHAAEPFVDAALAGNPEAFEQIVTRFQSTIADQMHRFSRDRSVIEELVHEVFVEAWISRTSFRSQSPFIHWLRKIAVRVGYRYWKKRSRDAAVSELPDAGQLISRINENAADAHETLGSLLELLPVRDRLVLTLIYWDGRSVAEAAELAGWSQATVKVQAYRARKKLRKLIEESLS